MMRKPRKWWLPLTYHPKIPGVQEGRIRQTLREGWKYIPRDRVAFHGWEGVPRHSKWSWRTGWFMLHMAQDIFVVPTGLILYTLTRGWIWYPWEDPIVEGIAALDGIDPPTGPELGRVLASKNKIDPLGNPFQILRW